MKYCIWNNKGGVGKTFVTYCMAVEYAFKNPDKKVVVIDLCPQANVSSILLGGDGTGEGNLAELYERDRTIASYIKDRFINSRYKKIGTEIEYFIRPADYGNKSMPENIFLVPGDMDLDICANIIDAIARDDQVYDGAWKISRMFVQDLMDAFAGKYGNADTTYFIDCNPSFANYTQLGILASDRLIIPCNADSFSIRGIKNVCRLIYGKLGGDKSDDRFNIFAREVKKNNLTLPQIHDIILNRSRTFNSIKGQPTKPARAFKASEEEINNLAVQLRHDMPENFTAGDNKVHNLKDCNTISAVLNFSGIRPDELKATEYEVYDQKVNVNIDQIKPLMTDLNSIVENL